MDLAKLDKAIRSSKEGDLSKGIVDDFTYGNKALEITKTGKDLKVLLAKVGVSLESHCQELKSKMAIALSMIKAAGCNDTPSKTPSSYTLQGLRREAFPYLPNMFTYEQKYGKDTMNKTYDQPEAVTMGGDYGSSDLTKMGDNQVEKSGDIKKYMNEYNNCVSSYISKSADKLFIDGIINSLGDKTSVKLSGQMLKLLV
tara:strand:- start:107183 stop:107779 length:597 start_codon:yes stop_codon:yes gene_type:complete